MANLLKAEFYKLYHSRSFWGLALFSTLLGSLMLLDSDGKTEGLFYASLYNTPLLYFLTIIFAALFVGNDFGERTLQSFICAGNKRNTVLFTKVVTYQVACVVILVVPLLVHTILEVMFQKGEEISASVFLLSSMIILVSIWAMCMLPLFFAFLFKDMGRTLSVSMVCFFLMIFALNSDKLNYAAFVLPMGQIRLLSLRELSLPAVLVVGIDTIWIIVLYLGAYISFCRSDLK